MAGLLSTRLARLSGSYIQMRETTIRVSATKRTEQGFHHRWMWNSVLPSENKTVFLPAPSEHRTTFPLLYTIVELKRGFSFGGMEHGFFFTIREWNMVLFQIGGWNRVSTHDGAGFRSTTSDWKNILGLRLPPVKNGTGFPLSEDGTWFLCHHWRMEENFFHSAYGGTGFRFR